MKRIGVYDGLKGIAVIGIFCIHVGVNTNVFTGRLYELFTFGNRGVELTYIISALLLTSQYYVWGGVTKYPTALLRKYVTNIIPIYYIFVIGSVLYRVVLLGKSVSLGAVATHLLFVNVLFGSWGNSFGGTLYFSCLVVTCVFYFLYLKHINNIRKSVVCGLIIQVLTTFICMFSYVLPVGYSLNITYLCRCISSFAVGNIVWHILSSEVFKQVTFTKLTKSVATGFLVFVILYYMVVIGNCDNLILLWIFAGIILLNYRNPIFLISNPVFNYLGKRVLHIFCWHSLIHVFLIYYMKNDIMYFIIVAVLTLLLSELTYRLQSMGKTRGVGKGA